MKLISTIGSVLAVAALLSSCKTKDPYAQTGTSSYTSPYYGQTATTTPQYGDYVDVAPVQPQTQQNYTYQPEQPSYQAPSYNSQPTYTPQTSYQEPSYQQPAYQPPVDTTPVSGMRSHTVTKGDTLYNISQRYGTTVGAIQQANGLADSTLIRLGETISVP